MVTRRWLLPSLLLIAGWLGAPGPARAGTEFWVQNDVDGYPNDNRGVGNASVAYRDGEVHDFYRDPVDGTLRHVTAVGGLFQASEVIDGLGGTRGEEMGDVGGTGIAAFVLADWIHLFYGDTSGNLRHAQRDPNGNWSMSTILGPSTPTASGTWGWFNSHVCAAIVYDGIQVIFSQYGQINRAFITANGWEVQTMGYVSNASPNTWLGPDAVAVVSNGRMEAYYTDVGQLHRITWDGATAGADVVDGAGGASGQVSGGLDSRPGAAVYQGQVHLFYRQAGVGNGSQTRVRHAWGNGSVFSFENLDGPGSAWTSSPADHPGAYASASVVGNQLHVVYRNERTCFDWNYAIEDGSGIRHARWVPEQARWIFDDVPAYTAQNGRGGSCQAMGDARGEDISLATYSPVGDSRAWLWMFDYDHTNGDLLAADWEVITDWTPDSCAGLRILPEQEGHYHGTIDWTIANDYAGTCGGSAGGDAIYRITLTQSRRLHVDTLGSAIDTVLYLRSGGACPGTAEIASACSNDVPGLPTSSLDRTLAAGTYYIVVDAAPGATGAFKLNVSLPLPIFFVYPTAPALVASDATWSQRSGSAGTGWMMPGYIGSRLERWMAATSETPMGGAPWYSISGMPPQTAAQWIWNYDSRSSSDTNTVFFRKWFTANASQATVFVTADNAFTLWVNGTAVGSGDQWNQVYAFTVPVTPGTSNLIAVETVNAGGPGGLLVDVR